MAAMNKSILVLLLILSQYLVPGSLSSAPSIKVGIYNNDPLIFANNEGNGAGIFADIIDYVAVKEGWKIEYVPGNWQQCLSRLESRQIDILCTIGYSDERAESFSFNKENILTNWGQVYTRTGSEIKAITELAGKKVAILKGDLHQTAFNKLLASFGVDCTVIEVEDYHSVLKSVETGSVDAGIVNRFFGIKYGNLYKVDKSGVIFNPIKIHYAVPKGDDHQLIGTIDQHIKALKNDENSVYYRSLDKWFGSISPGSFTPRWFRWALAGTGGVLGILFLGNLVLRARVRSRTKDLTIELDRRRSAEKALHEAYTIINRSPAVAFLWKCTEGWPVEFVSGNVLELSGFSSEDFMSGLVPYADIVHPEDADRVASEVESFSSDIKNSFIIHEPYRIIAKDGKIKWLDDRTYIRRDDSGKISHYEGIVVDITDKMNASEILKEHKDKLVRSRKMESLGLLAGGVAHDLNNVLSGIVSYPDLLLLELPENSKFRTIIKTIKESGDRAAAIVQDLLTVARGVATMKEPLNLNVLISNYLLSPEFLRLEHFHPIITIKSELSENLLNIVGSGVHIRKLIMNLVSNASEAIKEQGTVTISTTNRYVNKPLKGYDEIEIGEYAVLSVSDNGPGISSEDYERIFEPFYTKKVLGRSGTGLGLAVVWNVVQDHQAHIDVKTQESGTRFDIFFPITRDSVATQESAIAFEKLRGNREKILVVDDIESQRDITCKMLLSFGYQPVSVSSGEEAVEYVSEHHADLIVLDMIMDPGINGLVTYERILGENPGQKAIIVSGFAETDDVIGAQELGAGKFLKKPLTLEMLGIAVKEELSK